MAKQRTRLIPTGLFDLASPIRIPGLGRKWRLGGPPGIETAEEVATPPEEGRVRIRCLDYGPERVAEREVEDLGAFLTEPRPEWAAVRWVNMDGLHPFVINSLREAYPFHTLAAEDVLHVPQRSKLEAYDDHLFVVAHMMSTGDGTLTDEQVSLVHRPDVLLTFQERPGDVWDPVRARIQKDSSRLRRSGSDYLLYALLDALVDNIFPILEAYGDRLEAIENRIVENATPRELQQLYAAKRELVSLRRVLWPLRQVADDAQRAEYGGFQEETAPFFRDVYDHTLQVLDIVETYREMASGLTDLYMSSISNKMNEVMKVLTIMASLFIPVTFVAGVYGMNFQFIPELSFRYSYPLFWGVCISITVGLLIYFRRRGWIGG